MQHKKPRSSPPWLALLGAVAALALSVGFACSSTSAPVAAGSDVSSGQGGVATGGMGSPGGGTPSAGGSSAGASGGGGAFAGGLTGAGGSSAGGAPVGMGGAGTGATAALGGAGTAGGGTGAGGVGGASMGTAGTAGTGVAGMGAAGAATLVQPVARANGQYALEFGDLFFALDSKVGARVVTLTWAGGSNLLTGPPQNADSYGSTFRTSPQSAWSSTGWPPPPEIDSQAYTMSVTGQTIVGSSGTSAAIGAAVTKRFTADLSHQALIAEYTIQSKAAGKSFAPWEVSRVFPGGLTFYPTGDTAPFTSGTFTLPATQHALGCTWFTYPSSVTASQRLISDGKEGWLAHVTTDGLVFVKKFPDIAVAQQAPGEGEISIYVDASGKFVELENQGAYQAYTANQSVSWTVTWYVRKLPAGVTATVGSQALLDFVRSLVQ